MTLAGSLLVAAVALAGCSSMRLVTTGSEALTRAPVRTVRVEAATLPPPGHQVASLAWTAGGPGGPDPLADAVARGLAARGYQPVPGPDTDLVALYAVGTRTRPHVPLQQDATGAMTDQPTTQDGAFAYTERTVSLELVDARTGAVLWSGSASETLSPRAAVDVTRALAELLSRL
jgi:hypothetical protein